jgi:hypothetical protein
MIALFASLMLPLAARADDYELHGYLDYRGVSAPDDLGWPKGGLGKTRFGGGNVEGRFGGAAVVGTLQLAPEVLAFADAQVQSSDQPNVSLVEAWLRYRPVSLSPWRWSVKLGEFFPPVSLENTAVGWTSPWTLTPSAINSWVGEELRVIGGESRVEWRGNDNSFEGAVALYADNDPTGTLLDVRGWSLSDLTYGIGSRVREPDIIVSDFGETPPVRYNAFQEIDHRPGWYAHLAWRSREFGYVSLLRYDNEADGSAETTGNGNDVYAWHTKFWSLGARTDTGPVSWIAQGMDGATEFVPDGLDLKTDFQSAYLLAGWNRSNWRPALRWDFFRTQGTSYEEGPRPGEHGMALTAALNWQARSWLRVTAETLRVESAREPRTEFGLPAKVIDTQVQLSVRVVY